VGLLEQPRQHGDVQIPVQAFQVWVRGQAVFAAQFGDRLVGVQDAPRLRRDEVRKTVDDVDRPGDLRGDRRRQVGGLTDDHVRRELLDG
jgi:hypothetical protein